MVPRSDVGSDIRVALRVDSTYHARRLATFCIALITHRIPFCHVTYGCLPTDYQVLPPACYTFPYAGQTLLDASVLPFNQIHQFWFGLDVLHFTFQACLAARPPPDHRLRAFLPTAFHMPWIAVVWAARLGASSSAIQPAARRFVHYHSPTFRPPPYITLTPRTTTSFSEAALVAYPSCDLCFSCLLPFCRFCAAPTTLYHNHTQFFRYRY